MATARKVRKQSRKPKEDKPELYLPTEDNEPLLELHNHIMMIYGRKAIGKTTLANMFPNALTFMFEKWRRNLKIRQVPNYEEGETERKSLDWDDFKDYIDLFVESDNYDIAIIDTLDRCHEECFKWVCGNAGITHPDQAPNGYMIWNEVKDEFCSVISKLVDSGKGLIFLSHEKPKDINKPVKSLRRLETDDTDAKLKRMEPSCTDSCFKIAQEICDFILYYSYVGNERTITVRSPDEYAWTACGVDDHFLDPDDNPLNSFVIGNDASKSYTKLLEAYENKLYDIEYEPPREKKKFKRSNK